MKNVKTFEQFVNESYSINEDKKATTIEKLVIHATS